MSSRHGGRVGSPIAIAVMACLHLGAAAPASLPGWLAIDAAPTGVDDALIEAGLALAPAQTEAHAAEGHGYTDLLRSHTIHLAADGGLVRRVVLIRHYLSDEGARQAGTLELTVGTALETLTLERGEIRLAGGERRPVDLSRVEVATNASPGVFSDLALVSLPLPGVAPGASAVLVARYESRREDFPLPWSELFHPAQPVPVGRFSVVLSWDEGVPEPRWATTSGSLSCTSEAPRRLRCEQAQVPVIAPDPDVSNWHDLLPELAFGLPTTWDELATRELELVRSAATADPRIDAAVASIVEGAPTARQRLGRIHRFVADRVRYVAFEHGTGAVAPRPAATTLEQGFGDCKDKVALFLALARRVGLDAWPVLVGTNRYQPGRLTIPSWQYFDHMIACVDLPDADPICVDPTAPEVATGRLPAALHGRVALDLGRGPAQPRTLESLPYARRVVVERESRLSCDGSSEDTTHLRFHDGAAQGVRNALLAMPERERERWALSLFRDAIAEEPVPEVALSGLDTPDEPVVLRMTARYPATAELASRAGWAEPDSWLVFLGRSLGTTNRHHPYHLPGLEIVSSVQYQVCPSVRVAFEGAALWLEGRWGKLLRDYTIAGGSVRVHSSLAVPTTDVAPADVADFSRFLTATLGQTRIWFGWQPRPQEGR